MNKLASDSFAFSWAPFSSVCLSWSTPMCLFLYFSISFYFNYPFNACLFSNQRQKESGSTWLGRREETGREIVARIYYLRKRSIFNKRKKRGNIAPSSSGMSVELFGRELGIEVSCWDRHFIVTQSVRSDHLWDRYLILVT